MPYCLFVPVEGGGVEMADLDAQDCEAALAEAGRMAFGARTGMVYNGDIFIGHVTTAAGDAPRRARRTINAGRTNGVPPRVR